MAEKDRLTKKERRELGRAERKRKEEEAAKKARRARLISSLITVVVVGVVVAILVTAFSGGGGVAEPIALDFGSVEEARTAAGCEAIDVPPVSSRDHLEPASAPPAEALYPSLRPSAGGPHMTQPGPVATFNRPADERSVVHNMEHGSVVVWYAEEQAGDDVAAITGWADTLLESGFDFGINGAGIITSPFEGAITSGKPIAIRAWGVAMDCDRFDETAFNDFVLRTFGTHGGAPEGNAAPFPEAVMFYDPETLPDAPTDAPTAPGTDAPTDAATGSEAPTTEPTGEATSEPAGEPTGGATTEPTEAAS